VALDPLEALSSKAFCRVADAQQSSGNQVRLLRDGPQTFPAWLDAIGNARGQVHLENYILQEDSLGQSFADALIAAARRGAEVKVIYDWLGCLTRAKPRFWKQFTAAGVQVRGYNPPHISDPLRWISRDHRKVLVVDDEVAFTGGLCIGHDWMGDPARNIPPWRDTAIEIRGPAVAHIAAAFDDSWAAAGSRRHYGQDLPPGDVLQPDGNSGVDISVIAGRPDSMGLYRLEQLVAEIAGRSLWLTDGYFVATTTYVRALANAARSGVDVRLLVPGSSNWPLVGALSKSAYRPLLQAGVRVFEWNGPMVHAKTAVADGIWTRIGSSNSNLASWVTNRELDVTIKDRDLAAQMERMFEADMENSTEVVLTLGRTGVPKPVSSDDRYSGGGGGTSAGRLLSGAIGLGSTLTASFSRRRQLHPEESLVVLGGGLVLVGLGLIAIFLPHVIAWIIAICAIWPGLILLLRAFKLWQEDKSGKGG
jgi:cardiolipin synthase